MKKSTIRIGLATLVIVVLTIGDSSAFFGRGGGRGGGGMSRGGGGFSGGGMSRPSPSMNRSPSMSMPSAGMYRPSPGMASRPGGGYSPGVGSRPGGLPSTGARPGGAAGAGTRPGGVGPGSGVGSRPSTGQLNSFLNIAPGGGAGGASTFPANRPGNLGGSMAGGAAADFLQGGGGARPGTLPATRPGAGSGIAQRPGAGGGIADRPGAGTGIANRPDAGTGLANRTGVSDRMTDNRAGRIENRQQYQDNRVGRRDEVRNQVQENHPRLDFWSDHPGWAARRVTAPYRWAAWGSVAGWVGTGYGWTDAVPYSYGENVYYQDDSVYYGDQPVATAEEYAQQAETIVASAPEVAPEKADWLPLGVFALTQDGQKSGPDPTLFLQLAISKEGVISGTSHNTTTNQTQTVEGLADKASQRVAWAVEGKTRPIMETGISNLTTDTGPALVHFADGQTQQWLMVRLDEPAAQKAMATPVVPATRKAPIPPSPQK
jgi:hypothetical protein